MFNPQEKEEYWITISDMMTGLMLIFLFIAIAYMSKISIENQKFINIVSAYKTIQDEIFEQLSNEFKEDLHIWGGTIDRELLSITFNEPDILFEKGKDDIKPIFKAILEDFYPRYLTILSKDRFKSNIKSLRIEGHTSSEWKEKTSNIQAYINNMNLSQSRTSKVLDFVLNLKDVYNENLVWARDKIISVGFSSSSLKYNNELIEDKNLSRRVEFRIITNAEEKINEILDIEGVVTNLSSNELDKDLLEKKKNMFNKRAQELKQKDELKALRKKEKTLKPRKLRERDSSKNFLERLFGQ